MTAEVDGRVGRLPNDICRCHDAGCKDAVICARYVQRESGRLNAASLRGDAIQCASLILDRGEYHRVPPMLEQAQEDGLESCF